MKWFLLGGLSLKLLWTFQESLVSEVKLFFLIDAEESYVLLLLLPIDDNFQICIAYLFVWILFHL